MSDEPGEYAEGELKTRLIAYLSQDLYTARRIKDVLLPACLEQESLSRDELKDEFVRRGAAESTRDAGYFITLLSGQVGREKNDFLRQVIGYDYPNNPWEKDNYRVKEEYRELVREVLNELAE